MSPPITPTGAGSSTAYAALALAQSNEQAITAHEDLCAERYGNIHKTMADMKQESKDSLSKLESSVEKQFGEIKGILKWAGGALFTIIIGLLSFLATQQFTANEQARKSAESKIELLERQLQQQHSSQAFVGSTPRT